MANIKIKRGSGVPSGLTHGELAYDVTNKRLYIGITAASVLLANTDGGVASFNGLTGAVTGVPSYNGGYGGVSVVYSTGLTSSNAAMEDGTVIYTVTNTGVLSVSGISGSIGLTSGSGIRITSSGSTFTVTNIGVISFNGLTGAVTGVTTGTANTFQALQSFAAGISASGGGTLSNGTYNFSNLKLNTVGGDEGGQIDFGPAITNTSLTGGVSIDVYQNRVRIFESGGTNRGVYVDLSGVSSGVGTNLIGGGGSPVSSVSGSGNGISVSPTTGAVVVQNTGVHSFNGLTGAVTGVTTGTANTFGPLQSFTNGISASGGTFSGTLRTSTINPSTSAVGAGISLATNSGGSINVTSGSAAGDINLTAGGGGVNIYSQTTAFNITDFGSGIGGKIDTCGAVNIGDYGGFNNGTYVTINDAQMRMSMNSFMDLYAVPNIYFTNGEYIRNSTNGQIDIMPAPMGSTAYGIYFDMTSWQYGVIIGTYNSLGQKNTNGNIRFDVPLQVGTDVILSLGSDSQYGLYRTATGNDTAKLFAYCDGVNNSGAWALSDSGSVFAANRSPTTKHLDPNLYIYSRGSTYANDFVRFEHDRTNGNIVSGGTSGILIQPGSGQLGISGGICGGAFILNSTGIFNITGTGYTFAASDNGEVLIHNNAAGSTFTIPTGLPVGYSVTVVQIGAGQVNFSPASGVTLNSFTSLRKIAGQHGSASLISYATNIYNLAGNLA